MAIKVDEVGGIEEDDKTVWQIKLDNNRSVITETGPLRTRNIPDVGAEFSDMGELMDYIDGSN